MHFPILTRHLVAQATDLSWLGVAHQRYISKRGVHKLSLEKKNAGSSTARNILTQKS